MLYEVLKVVATCHSHQLVHGDVKPANFVLKTKHASAHRALQTGIGLQGAWLKAVDFGECLPLCLSYCQTVSRAAGQVSGVHALALLIEAG